MLPPSSYSEVYKASQVTETKQGVIPSTRSDWDKKRQYNPWRPFAFLVRMLIGQNIFALKCSDFVGFPSSRIE